ncbi:MAG: type 1 glutamine amidotransferase-like domain-containing protein [Desulfobacteraceae bacterium]|nr:type 1 glutamine amidotransferase-like domain-containing protein [Desulfobacteraceae bacterium]
MDSGVIVLMGSGELTGTMVEVHKQMLRPYGKGAKAVFIDTPAGFQLNVDQLTNKAVDYFKQRVGAKIVPVSFKSSDELSSPAIQQSLGDLGRADYILIGPGSPTYALRQWQKSPIPNLITQQIKSGACLVVSSAAALTIGSFTLPVYEIYKAGQDLYWAHGIDILEKFGLKAVVVPHWNNAEGGNHDTRFCFMGASRFKRLERMLPENTCIIGLDEHTALVIDLANEQATVKGIGNVVIRCGGRERIFAKPDVIALTQLFEDQAGAVPQTSSLDQKPDEILTQKTDDQKLWEQLNAYAAQCRELIAEHQAQRATSIILEFEHCIWACRQLLEQTGAQGAVRAILREMIALLGQKLADSPKSRQACLAPMVDALLQLRGRFREQKQWVAADQVRDSLKQAGVIIKDYKEGVRWHLK